MPAELVLFPAQNFLCVYTILHGCLTSPPTDHLRAWEDGSSGKIVHLIT